MYGRRRDDSSSHQTIVCSVHVHPRLFAFPPFTVNYYSRRERLHILNYNTCLSLVLNLFLEQLYPCSIRKTLILKALIEVVQVVRDSECTKDAKTRPNFSLLCQRKNSLWRINAYARVVPGRIFDGKLLHERAAMMINNATIVRANVYGIASLTRIFVSSLFLSLLFFLRGLVEKEKGSTIENFIRRWKRSLHKLSRMKDTARCWLCELTTKWTCSANFFE